LTHGSPVNRLLVLLFACIACIPGIIIFV